MQGEKTAKRSKRQVAEKLQKIIKLAEYVLETLEFL
jgi:hypothetical protein